jgi:hypothetical protein
MQTHPVSLSYIKIKNIFKEENLSNKEQRNKVEKELNILLDSMLNGQKARIQKLEGEVEEFKTVKRMFRKLSQ